MSLSPIASHFLGVVDTSVVLASTKVWWYVSRASGIVAWALAAMAVLWGLALSTRALGPKPRAPWLLDVHRFIGGLTLVFVGVHLVALVLDSFVSFGFLELFVPMASSWRPGAVAWGIVAFYLLVAVEVTSLLKRRIPNGLWRWVHFSSYALYATATVHLLLAGTDNDNQVLIGTAIASIAIVVFFTVYRFAGPGRAGSVRAVPRDGWDQVVPPPRISRRREVVLGDTDEPYTSAATSAERDGERARGSASGSRTSAD